ncbi:ABC transporter ATP-binding protein [Aminipila terrae]|uniref:ATP-binding cassette domain-containing protein n=1 Tax=Aminipila terrae TaxID=2697030 RepID=A0A6P1MI59_9FIRM|nr:ABC transporter ATP-binding protein [Aminipila terrae]QHI71678.1 ATP-binding cassette domain-containing protein [Aminipila terrae]
MIRVKDFLKNYKSTFAALILFTFLQTLGTLYIPTLKAAIVNNGVLRGNISYIAKVGAIMLLTSVLTGGITVWITRMSADASARISRDIRQAVFEKVQLFSVNDFNKIGTASMITRATSDVTLIGDTTIMFIIMLLPAPIMAIGGLCLAFLKDKVLAMIIVTTMIIFLIIALLMGKKVIPLFKQVQIKMDSINGLFRETVIGVRVIRAFNREKYEKSRVDAASSAYAENAVRINKMIAILEPIAMIIINGGIICILWIGGIRAGAGVMQIGDIMAMIEYCFLILIFLIIGVMIFMYIPRAQACAERIDEILAINPEIIDGAVIEPEKGENAHLQFEHVTFQYPNAEEPILSDITFQSKAGEITAIIGGTGSGKSTIANLILRFFEVQGGCIKIDGVDIRKLPQKVLRNKVGYVPQKNFLFSGTVAENIRYGMEDATQAQIEHAAQVAQAHYFIMGLDQQYESYVAQGGNNLSGGQKQRLAIARAIIRKPEFYIFDDSFSALDFKTDAKLRQALRNEIKNATVVMVAQRINTIMDADQIIVLEDGKIAGIGKHKELMKSCEVYKQIAASQLREDEMA